MELKFSADFGSSFKKEGAFDKSMLYDLLIIGSGPAGLNAALYAGRKGMKVGVVSGKPGGQVVDTASVENYLGVSFATGEALVEQFMNHVKTLKIPMLNDADVEAFEKKDDGTFELKLLGGDVLKAKALIIATGSKPRKLGIPGEDQYAGRGVAYCAICDGPLFEGRDVIVAGGGNSAVEAAVDLAKIAKSVTIIHRSQFRADQIVLDQLNAFNNVTVFLQTEIKEVIGEQLMTGVVVLDKETGETRTVKADGLFVEIGHIPNSQMAKETLKLDNHGEIEVNHLNETSIPGVFAAGDVTTVPYKQIIIAAGEGAKAALTANDYVNRLKR
jgi:alkyl hydroperoxide reductase subunit F